MAEAAKAAAAPHSSMRPPRACASAGKVAAARAQAREAEVETPAEMTLTRDSPDSAATGAAYQRTARAANTLKMMDRAKARPPLGLALRCAIGRS